MAWIKVESSVARNRKFVKAGPAPSWLWLCGLAYCQEGLTDGFIPSEALDYLGVKNASRLALHLVSAGLWAVVEGGWQVHDYFEHNRPAAEVRRIQSNRRAAGATGGIASGEARSAKQPSKQTVQHVEAAVEPRSDQISTDQISTATPSDQIAPMDEWCLEFRKLYPQEGITNSYGTQTAFVDVLHSDPSLTPAQAFEALKARLEGHKRSLRWRAKGYIPRMDRYLRDGLHLQVLPEESSAAPPPGARPVYTGWSCDHVERCDHRSMCDNKHFLGADRYPVKSAAVSA